MMMRDQLKELRSTNTLSKLRWEIGYKDLQLTNSFLIKLPSDVLNLIVLSLAAKDQISLASTCKLFRTANQPYLFDQTLSYLNQDSGIMNRLMAIIFSEIKNISDEENRNTLQVLVKQLKNLNNPAIKELYDCLGQWGCEVSKTQDQIFSSLIDLLFLEIYSLKNKNQAQHYMYVHSLNNTISQGEKMNKPSKFKKIKNSLSHFVKSKNTDKNCLSQSDEYSRAIYILSKINQCKNKFIFDRGSNRNI